MAGALLDRLSPASASPPEVMSPRRFGIPTRAVLPRPLRRRVAAFDRRVDRGFDHLRGRPAADRLFYVASELGDFSLLWLLLGAERGVRSEAEADAAVRLVGCLAAESLLVNGLIKSVFARTRPPWEQTRPHGLRRPRSSSFPSGHASAGFVAAALLSDRRRRPAAACYYGLAVLVASSRIHVKIHHPSDVVVGVALGAAIGAAAKRAWPLPAHIAG
ncbi:hypothetical protein BH20ACT2_BH20ACT2_12260 [soil metagenome]